MRLFRVYVILLLLALWLTGCGLLSNHIQTPSEDQHNDNGLKDGNVIIPDSLGEPNKEITVPESKDDLDENDEMITSKIKEMTLDEKVGQMFIFGFEGTDTNEMLTNMMETKSPGGVILFQRNVENSEQLLDLINSIKEINKGREPLFISVDQEAGRVSRMPKELRDIPSAEFLGEYDDAGITHKIGELLAEEIASFGFNMNFAPVLDIMTNPDNTAIKERAFGNTTQAVSKHGIQMMKGIRNKGVIPVVKHFPGHGDTGVDSHKELPSIDYDMDSLADFELVPFQEAINENADAVMVSHLLMNKIDPENPATMSKAVITNLLRNDMNFQGVVVTDDMTMGAIINNYDIGDAAVSSVVAGSDIIMVCHGYDKQTEAMDAVRSAVETGFIQETRIDESVARILKLKAKYGLKDEKIDSIDIDELNKKIDGQLAKWYNGDNK
jgi:beta-N-acetylhexosaminidase